MLRRLEHLPLMVILLLTGLVLSGCTDSITSHDENTSEQSFRLSDSDSSWQGKLRHAHLLERATNKGATGKFGNEVTLNLIFKITPQSAMDPYAVLDRFATLDRYHVLERFEYSNVFDGFAITVSDSLGDSDYNAFLDTLTTDTDVEWVEPDIVVESSPEGVLFNDDGNGQLAPWSLDEIGHAGQTAAGVDIFIVDTGVSSGDVNLVEALDTRIGIDDPADNDGHGTHVAGIAAAYDDGDGIRGVAPGARVRSLKVINGDEVDDGGEVDLSAILEAVDYITSEKLAHPNMPMVVNMSLGADTQTELYNALDEAIEASIAVGVVYVIAAGNQSMDTATVTPAHVENAIVVGAYGLNKDFAAFSNKGSEIDILAPGVDIVSLTSSASGAAISRVFMSGTSMAAPHVAGAAALYLSQNPTATPAQVHQALMDASEEIITNVPNGTSARALRIGQW